MIDDSTEERTTGGHMTLWEHLAELRSRIVKCVIAIALGAVVGWLIFGPLLDFLQRPYCDLMNGQNCDLIATGPHEGRPLLAAKFGWRLEEDDDDPTGEVELVPLTASRR